MNEVKNKVFEWLQSTNRKGIDNLVEHLDKESDFFTAPCSSQYHLCKEGGLAEHSLNVYKFGYEYLPFLIQKDEIGWHSWAIVALLHDIGKSTYHRKPNYVPNYLKDGKLSSSKPYESNKDRLYIPHEIVSLQIISKYINLTEEEEFAILYHNGLYVASGRDIQGKERPLQQLLHFSDMWCSRFVEKEAIK